MTLLPEALTDIDPHLWRTLAAIGIAIAGALVLRSVAGRTLHRLSGYLERRHRDSESAKRVGTILRSVRYASNVIIVGVALFVVLHAFGVSVGPLLATAGVAGIAIGIGAQGLVKDYFTGFVLLCENQIRQGDVVEVAGKEGLVEDVTLRYVRLRDYDGNVHFVPHGAIVSVTNRSMDYAYSVCDVRVAHRVDIARALRVIREVADAMAGEKVPGLRILEGVEIVGVEALDDSGVTLRCRFKVAPLTQWDTRRLFFRRIKDAFEREGVEIAVPRRQIITDARDDERHESRPG